LSQTFQPLGKVEPNVAGLWIGGLWIGGLWIGGLADWLIGGLVDWWIGGLVDWWIGVLWFVGFIFVLSQPFGSTFPKG
jgi:hypothetical protein